MKKSIACVVLAAGKSTRMKSHLPKVLHPICGRPLLAYVLDLIKALRIKKTVTVVGHHADSVSKIAKEFGAESALQKKLLGTADAVKVALTKLKSFSGDILILYGDMPLLTKETLSKLIEHHYANNLDATILTAVVTDPKSYGRVLRDQRGNISGIVEENDANDAQKEIKEINTGIIIFKKKILESALSLVKLNPRKKEFYLTDVVGILYKNNSLVESVKTGDFKEAQGINSRMELSEANKIMQLRINREIMNSGVSIVDPASTFINFGTKIGEDSTIYPFTVMENNVKLGKRCQVGPFIHLREGTRLNDDCLIGNFVEVVRSTVGKHTFAKHFSYMGDARIGNGVNIGAGTVIANFDGEKKNLTTIKDKAFIGSDTVIISPVVVGKKGTTGAGSVVVKHTRIPDGGTVVGVPARLLKKSKK